MRARAAAAAERRRKVGEVTPQMDGRTDGRTDLARGGARDVNCVREEEEDAGERERARETVEGGGP